MPEIEVAQFAFLSDSDDAFEATGRPFVFDLPDLDSNREAVLTFKVSGPKNANLQFAVTSVPAGGTINVVKFQLDATFSAPRAWTEVVKKGAFKESNNRMIVEPFPGGIGNAKVSDIVVLYHARKDLGSFDDD
jgi:hypothetical protein